MKNFYNSPKEWKRWQVEWPSEMLRDALLSEPCRDCGAVVDEPCKGLDPDYYHAGRVPERTVQ